MPHNVTDLSPKVLAFLERLESSQEIDELKILLKDIKSKKVVISTDVLNYKEKLERLIGLLLIHYPGLMNYPENKNLINLFMKTLDQSAKANKKPLGPRSRG